MITKLFRTSFENNLVPFFVFITLNVLSLFLLATHHDPNRPASTDMYMFLTFWLLLFCLVAGGLALQRNNRDKSSRLYAQLPVTSLQVRIAYWCQACLYLGVSALVMGVVIFYFSRSLLNAWLFALLYFFHAALLTALISIVNSNKLRLIPDHMRKNTVSYLLLAALVVCGFVLLISLAFEGYAHVYGARVPSWYLLTGVIALVSAALVLLDIYLFRRKDSYVA